MTGGIKLTSLSYDTYTVCQYTPNANMADHSVGARDESNGSEAFVLKMLPQKTLALSSICSVLFRSAYELLCF